MFSHHCLQINFICLKEYLVLIDSVYSIRRHEQRFLESSYSTWRVVSQLLFTYLIQLFYNKTFSRVVEAPCSYNLREGRYMGSHFTFLVPQVRIILPSRAFIHSFIQSVSQSVSQSVIQPKIFLHNLSQIQQKNGLHHSDCSPSLRGFQKLFTTPIMLFLCSVKPTVTMDASTCMQTGHVASGPIFATRLSRHSCFTITSWTYQSTQFQKTVRVHLCKLCV